jgi:hypothetical protein
VADDVAQLLEELAQPYAPNNEAISAICA